MKPPKTVKKKPREKRAQSMSPEQKMHGATPEQLKIIELFGTVDFDPNYDYKAERRSGR